MTQNNERRDPTGDIFVLAGKQGEIEIYQLFIAPTQLTTAKYIPSTRPRDKYYDLLVKGFVERMAISEALGDGKSHPVEIKSGVYIGEDNYEISKIEEIADEHMRIFRNKLCSAALEILPGSMEMPSIN